MLRKVAILAISAGLTMSPIAAHALGFGGIKLKSSLNEKLNAEVSLLSASANDVQSLRIHLATEEAFLRAGIDRTALLNKLKFKVKQNSSGDYYIHVTTTESVREPFMNFLLEMNWKNGRMLREYTMLVDPPGRAPAPVQQAEPAPVVAETVEPVETPMEAEIDEPSPFVEAVVEPVVEPIIDIEPEPVVEVPEEMEAAAVVEAAPPLAVMPEEHVLANEPLEAFVPIGGAVEEEEPAVVVEEEVVTEAEPEVIVDVEPEVVAEPEAIMDVVEEPVAAEEMVTEAEVFTGGNPSDVWPSIPLSAFDKSDDFEAPVDVAEAGGELGDLDYGIVKKNDNLWNIAEKLRQGDNSVSVHQVMMALLQSNPDAFIDNNVHRLKVGHVLRIEDAEALTRISRKEAAAAFVEQTNAWDSYRQQVAGNATVQPIMAGGTETTETTGSADTAGELTLAAPDGESLTAGGGANEESLNNDLATIQDQLRQAKSDAGTMRTRNVDLNNKLQSLEDELNRLQRSVSIKDDELAALQQQLSSLNQKPVEMPAEPVAEAAPVEPAAVEEVAKPEVVEEPAKPEITEPVAEVAKPVTDVPKPVEPEIIPEPVPQEQGIMDTVMGIVASVIAVFAGLGLGGDSLLYIAGPILLILLIVAAIVIKRRRQGDNFQESILTGSASAVADGAAVQSGDSTTFSEESSFLSDFAMSGASAIEADDSEVDPLTEADVFMAYGRYEAAEERLNEAIQSEPSRMELRAKLLELYHATQNKDAFESSAEDFYAGLGGNEAESPLWDKVVSMGSEIAPANPLFNQGTADIPATSEVPAIDDPGMAMTDSQVMDIGLETGVFAAADLSQSGDTSADDMDFNLDLGDLGDLGGSADAAEPAMDFNLDIGGDEATTAEAEPATADDGLDFNLDIGGDEVASAEEPAGDLDFNLDMGTTDDSPDAAGLDFDLDIGGSDAEDVSLDFDTADSSSSDDGLMDLNLDATDTADADIGGGDEVGTKLDLAKAYIDMGDPEGARSILDEVMDEGSSTQKEEAQSLLGQIA